MLAEFEKFQIVNVINGNLVDHNMKGIEYAITPHEYIAGHWFSYNRHERHCGGVVTQDLRGRN
jgi:hypothetical protein